MESLSGCSTVVSVVVVVGTFISDFSSSDFDSETASSAEVGVACGGS